MKVSNNAFKHLTLIKRIVQEVGLLLFFKGSIPFTDTDGEVLETFLIFTFLYINRKESFLKNFRFPAFDGFIYAYGCPEFDHSTLIRPFLEDVYVCDCDKKFAVSMIQK